jgi:hypothetical protein
MPDEAYFSKYGLPRFTEESLIKRSGRTFTPEQIQNVIRRAAEAGLPCGPVNAAPPGEQIAAYIIHKNPIL